ncbi:MAG: hypothetical protein K2X44_03400, partial [Magnetospirillum sp.]|nr:hypothetical protein [Magnetospirillum sp.]
SVAASDEFAAAGARFKGVMRTRHDSTGLPGLVGLFAAIRSSTKFAENEKPTCYRMLTTGIASTLKGSISLETAKSIVDAVGAYEGMAYLAQDTRDMVAARYVRWLLDAAIAVNDVEAVTMLAQILSAQIAVDREDILRLATLAGMPEESIDLLAALA